MLGQRFNLRLFEIATKPFERHQTKSSEVSETHFVYRKYDVPSLAKPYFTDNAFVV